MAEESNIAEAIEIPEHEEERLNTLWEYDILDTVEEEEFDAITRLAARICDVSASMVNLIDSECQWTKSSYGIDWKEIPRDESLCAYTIVEDKSVEIEDLTEDSRFKHRQYVKEEPNLKFYAAVPLKSPKGYNIGALCVIDDESQILSKWQLECLRNLCLYCLQSMAGTAGAVQTEKKVPVLVCHCSRAW